MEIIITGTLQGVFSTLIVYGLYCFIRNRWYNASKWYLMILFSIGFVFLFRMLFEEEFDILGFSVHIIGIIIFISIAKNSYRNDAQYRSLFECLSSIHMKPVFVTGIFDIEKENIDCYVKELQQIQTILGSLSKKPYAYLAFEDGKVKISLMVMKKRDFDDLIRCSFDRYVEITDVEQYKYGGSATILLDIMSE